tara:strand:+ start:389 stop:511 length:123 start_codon:yes stop_codon:yes gene_type:complete
VVVREDVKKKVREGEKKVRVGERVRVEGRKVEKVEREDIK